MTERVAAEIGLSNEFANRIEELFCAKGQVQTDERNALLLAYWSLIFELHRAILGGPRTGLSFVAAHARTS